MHRLARLRCLSRLGLGRCAICLWPVGADASTLRLIVPGRRLPSRLGILTRDAPLSLSRNRHLTFPSNILTNDRRRTLPHDSRRTVTGNARHTAYDSRRTLPGHARPAVARQRVLQALGELAQQPLGDVLDHPAAAEARQAPGDVIVGHNLDVRGLAVDGRELGEDHRLRATLPALVGAMRLHGCAVRLLVYLLHLQLAAV